MNVKINYITDGDIAGALKCNWDKPKNDIYYSTGGAQKVYSCCSTYLVMEVKFKDD